MSGDAGRGVSGSLDADLPRAIAAWNGLRTAIKAAYVVLIRSQSV